jgi:hypothetical protein
LDLAAAVLKYKLKEGLQSRERRHDENDTITSSGEAHTCKCVSIVGTARAAVPSSSFLNAINSRAFACCKVRLLCKILERKRAQLLFEIAPRRVCLHSLKRRKA